MTVYITSQPLAGAVRSKAIFRVFGTLLGASFAVLVVPILVDTPVLLSLALAGWLGMCLFISLLDRTPRAYVMMLAGYTACLIAFPTVNTPQLVFDIAVSRVEEILLGIFCAAFTHSVFFPRPVGTVLLQRLAAWLAEGDAWALDLLRGRDPAKISTDRQHLAAATTEIQILSGLLPFDTSTLRNAGANVRALHQRLSWLIPVLSGIGDRMAALGAHARPIQPEIDAVADWIDAKTAPDVVPSLMQRLEAARTAQINRDWNSLLRESLLSRLQDLVVDLNESQQLLSHLRHPDIALPPSLAATVANQTHNRLRPDVGMAAISGLSAMLSVLLVCTLWILSGWPEGSVAAALAGVFCAIFAAMDDPAPAIIGMGLFSTLALPVAALYQFAILPSIDGFTMLAVVLAPPFLLAGSLMFNRRTAGPALFFVMGLISALALQETYSVDFASFVNNNTAQYVGLFVALLVTRGMRSMSVDAAAQRLLVRNWKTLAGLAQRERDIDLQILAADQVDRLGLLTPKLATAKMVVGSDLADAVIDLRITMNVAALQKQRANMPPDDAAETGEMLKLVGRHFAERAAGRVAAPGSALLEAIDHCLDRIARATAPDRRDGVIAMVALRNNLFPAAPAFQPQPSMEAN